MWKHSRPRKQVCVVSISHVMRWLWHGYQNLRARARVQSCIPSGSINFWKAWKQVICMNVWCKGMRDWNLRRSVNNIWCSIQLLWWLLIRLCSCAIVVEGEAVYFYPDCEILEIIFHSIFEKCTKKVRKCRLMPILTQQVVTWHENSGSSTLITLFVANMSKASTKNYHFTSVFVPVCDFQPRWFAIENQAC